MSYGYEYGKANVSQISCKNNKTNGVRIDVGNVAESCAQQVAEFTCTYIKHIKGGNPIQYPLEFVIELNTEKLGINCTVFLGRWHSPLFASLQERIMQS